MSRPVVVSKRAQNGSLTSEPDSMNQHYPSKSGPERPREGRNARPNSKDRRHDSKGPDTSTPVKEEKRRSYPKPNNSGNKTDNNGAAMRRNLEDDLAACNAPVNDCVFDLGGGYTGGNVQRKTSSHFISSGANNSNLSSNFQDQSTAFAASVTKKSFVSEFENGTIQAQRQELQLLISELKDRDRELNDMVKSHQEQLHGWEEDRQRLLKIEQKYAQVEAEKQRKSEQIRALVARLRGIEAAEKKTRAALEETQSNLSRTAEQHNKVYGQLNEVQEKNQKLGSMIKELSTTLGKLEKKEQEMLVLLKQKDQELAVASDKLAALEKKFKLSESKFRQSNQELDEAKKEILEMGDKLLFSNSEVEKLKCDLDRSRQEEDESKLELERGRREVERMKGHVKMMYEKEKRQEELIASQKKKQERTDAELSSLRLLYERQQRDMSMLHLNLESTKELLLKQQQNNEMEQCNISLLLQSPTCHQPAVTSSGENNVSLTIAHTSQHTDPDPLIPYQPKAITQLKLQPAPLEGTTPNFSTGSDTGYVTATPVGGSSDTMDVSKRNSSGTPHRQENRSGRSGIPVRIDGSRAGTPRANVPMSPLNESIKDISEQSRKLGEIIEASRKQRENENAILHDQENQLTLSKAGGNLTHGDQNGENTDKSVVLSGENKSLTTRHYSYPYNGHFESGSAHTSGTPDVEDRRGMEYSLTDMIDTQDVVYRDGFATPPRTSHKSSATPSPHHQINQNHLSHLELTPDSPLKRTSMPHKTSQMASFEGDFPELRDSFEMGSQEGSYRDGAVREERGEKDWTEALSVVYPNGPDSPGLSSIRSEVSDEMLSHGAESPTSKLHRLLTESRQMVINLERSTYPPFFLQDSISPIRSQEKAAVEDT